MGNFFRTLLDVLFPPRCIFCRSFLSRSERYWCSDCSKNLPYTDGVRIYGDAFEFAVAPLFYQDNVRSAIHRYKFRGLAGYASGFGSIVAGCVRTEIGNDYDLITWVPVSGKRRKSRGYDQSMLIAQAAALELDNVAIETIRKKVDNPAQSTIDDPVLRRMNVESVFDTCDPELISGKRILLIDDIITSGATLSSCAGALLHSGARSVICVTLANAAFSKM